MKTAQNWIDDLGLLPHPEGGFYKEVYRSPDTITKNALPSRFNGDRSTSTSIYFMLRSGEKSHFHRIQSDEIWYFHQGSSISIYILDAHGITIRKVGPDCAAGESLQVTIPAGVWFGAVVNASDSFALCSCSVSPGFDFADFELAQRDILLKEYPSFKNEIVMLTNP